MRGTSPTCAPNTSGARRSDSEKRSFISFFYVNCVSLHEDRQPIMHKEKNGICEEVVRCRGANHNTKRPAESKAQHRPKTDGNVQKRTPSRGNGTTLKTRTNLVGRFTCRCSW